MQSIAGIFNSFADAKRAAAILRSLGISEERISVLSPHTKENEIEARVPIEDVEQRGIGPAIGGAIGAAMGVAAGTSAGAAAATLLIPGVGPVLAFGLLGAAIFGTGGAAAGALVGETLEGGLETGLPHDELYIYEDALRRGRSLVIAFTDDEQIAEKARVELKNAGAEAVDAARDDWWLGLRDVEQEHYAKQGGDFKIDEAKYRLGFEAALHPKCRGKHCEEVALHLEKKYGGDSTSPAFRKGFERGQRYQEVTHERYNVASRQKDARRAA